MKANTYSQLVFLRQFVHTQDSNNILKRLVVLKDLLDGGGNVVVLLANLFMTHQPTNYTSDTKMGYLTIRGSNIRDLESRGSTAG